MAYKADPIGQMARDLCRRFPDHPSRSLARRLVENANGAITLEAARSRIRQQFGVVGTKSRKYAKQQRKPRKPGEGVDMPKSQAEPWLPAELDVTGLVGVISDVHVPYH